MQRKHLEGIYLSQREFLIIQESLRSYIGTFFPRTHQQLAQNNSTTTLASQDRRKRNYINMLPIYMYIICEGKMAKVTSVRKQRSKSIGCVAHVCTAQ